MAVIQRTFIFSLLIVASSATGSTPRPPEANLYQVEFDSKHLKNGLLTEKTLAEFLAQSYKQKMNWMESFRSETCIKVKSLGESFGFNTLQLFAVTSRCASKTPKEYIIKESATGAIEAVKLDEIMRFPGIKEIAAPNRLEGFPTLALSLIDLTYEDDYGIPHVITVLPKAKGKQFCDFIEKYKAAQSAYNKSKLAISYYALGKELANFQRRFAVHDESKLLSDTLVHGDLKCLNMFYDESSSHFTFIDNETMEASLYSPRSPSEDIAKVLFGYYATNEDKRIQNLINGLDLQKWYHLTFKSFVKGYLAAFPVRQRHALLDELRVLINSPFIGIGLQYNEKAIDAVRSKYIKPIFEELESENN